MKKLAKRNQVPSTIMYAGKLYTLNAQTTAIYHADFDLFENFNISTGLEEEQLNGQLDGIDYSDARIFWNLATHNEVWMLSFFCDHIEYIYTNDKFEDYKFFMKCLKAADEARSANYKNKIVSPKAE